MLKSELQLVRTEEHVASESRNARAQRYVVFAEVVAVWVCATVLDVMLAAVHGVDGTVV